MAATMRERSPCESDQTKGTGRYTLTASEPSAPVSAYSASSNMRTSAAGTLRASPTSPSDSEPDSAPDASYGRSG
jgi:hypothetical protein